MAAISPVAMQHLRAAAAALEAGDLRVAHESARAALSVAPNSPDGWNLMGLIEFHAGRHDLARAALERAVQINPRYANAWQNLASALDAMQREADAIEPWARALEANPRQATFDQWYNLGVRAHRHGRLARAAQSFEQALKLKPREPGAMNNLAVVLDAQRKPAEAKKLVSDLLEAAPGSVQARHTFAAIWSRSTEPEDLARALIQALSVLRDQPRHAGAHECAAVVLAKQGNYPQALEHARAAVAHGPGQPAHHATLVRLLDESGQLDEAAAALQAALAAHPEHALLTRLQGQVALKQGRAADADESYRRAYAHAPDDQATIAQRGAALYALGDRDRARAWLGAERFIASMVLEVPAPFADAASFNRALAEDIRRHSRLRYEPVGLAAKGGYLTEDLLADRTAAIEGFERSLRRAIDRYRAQLAPDASHPFLRAIPQDYRLNIWATRVAAQGVIDTHIHDESWLSGAYYVELPPAVTDPGEDPHAGWIEFLRPFRGLPAPPDAELIAMRPATGNLLLFPSYLYHRTLPFSGAGERISISFDLAGKH